MPRRARQACRICARLPAAGRQGRKQTGSPRRRIEPCQGRNSRSPRRRIEPCQGRNSRSPEGVLRRQPKQPKPQKLRQKTAEQSAVRRFLRILCGCLQTISGAQQPSSQASPSDVGAKFEHYSSALAVRSALHDDGQIFKMPSSPASIAVKPPSVFWTHR